MTKPTPLCSCQRNILSLPGSLVDHDERTIVDRLQLLIRIEHLVPVRSAAEEDSPYKRIGDAVARATLDELPESRLEVLAHGFEAQAAGARDRGGERSARIARTNGLRTPPG
jgi:hypothetical protein